MKVLSLFDGISCGRIALERANIPIEKYYASEIDKYAIQVSNKNYPDIIHIGDITKLDFNEYKDIDLIIGGSPCQDLSNYKYDRGEVKGLDGKKSSLFYYYVKALKTIKPKYFLLENVASMQQKWIDVISNELGVKPVLIESSLVSAAERHRLYWTNIKIDVLQDKNLKLKDIMQSNVEEKYFYKDKYAFEFHGVDKKVCATLMLNGHRQAKEVYSPNFKCNTLLCDGNGGNLVKKVWDKEQVRKLTPVEYERLQNIPDNYTDCVADSRRYTAIGNGWTVDVISHILGGIK
jgi:DNA (cytosine-5)-methyltransferase 3A